MLKRITLGDIILIGTLFISVPRYAAAFSQAEPTFFGFSIAPATGLGFGLLLEAGIYYTIKSWFEAQRNRRKWHELLVVGFGVQLFIAPIIIAPAIVGHVVASKNELAAVLTNPFMLWMWAIVAAGAPALLLAAVAAASYLREPTGKKRDESKPSKKQADEKEEASEPEPEEVAVLAFACDECPRVFDTQQGLNAHKRTHRGGNGTQPAEEVVEAGAQHESEK